MKYYYSIRTDIIHGEDGKAWTVYGVTVTDADGAVLSTTPDVFPDKSQAEEFVDRCNRLRLDPVHIMDAIEDALVF